MRFILFLLFILFATFTSCKNNTVKSPDLVHAQWAPLNSSTKYLLYNSDEKLLTNADSITVSFAGKQAHDSITFSKADSLVCTIITGCKFGKFVFSDSSFNKEVSSIKSKLKKHSTAYIKWYPDTTIYNRQSTIRVFLKKEDDSIKSLKLTEKISGNFYVSSCSYISKSTALKKFVNMGADTAFLSFLEKNPLPASIEFTLKPEYLNAQTLQKISQEISKEPNVSEVQLPNLGTDNIAQFLFGINFFIKISS
jgi:hypothetical protein